MLENLILSEVDQISKKLDFVPIWFPRGQN